MRPPTLATSWSPILAGVSARLVLAAVLIAVLWLSVVWSFQQ